MMAQTNDEPLTLNYEYPPMEVKSNHCSPAESTIIHDLGNSQRTPQTECASSSSGGCSKSTDIQESDVVEQKGGLHTDDTSGDNDECGEILLSIFWYARHLGAAYYDTETAVVQVLLDTLENDQFFLVRRLVADLNPSVVIVSAKQDERMVQIIQKLMNNVSSSTEKTGASSSTEDVLLDHETDNESMVEGDNFKLEILPSTDFVYESSKLRIVVTKLPGIPDHYTEMERNLHMSARVPFDSVTAVRAVGGLMRYLDKNRIGVGLEDNDVKTPILDFKTFTLKNVMYVEQSTYSALQIFKKIDHPSAFKMGSGSKEGLSLFGILNRTRSRPGKRLLRLWFNRPLSDKKELERRLDTVDYFVRPQNLEIMRKLQESLKNLRNLNRILTQMRTATASVSEWIGFYKTVISVVSIADICRNASCLPDHRTLPSIFQEIANSSTQNLVNVVKLIYHIMDREESIAQNRFIVQPGIDEELDEKKRLYNKLPTYLHQVALKELNTFKKYISSCHVMYMRRVGYLLALKVSDGINEQNCAIPGLEFMLTSEDVTYFKTQRTRELDCELGDILVDIGDQETTIMHQLQNSILEHTPVLLEVSQLAAELDCLISFALVAKELNYVRPTLTSENIIEVKGGRHPLQECTVSLFVPNDIMLGNEHGRIRLLTGPNACGKSIFLKQAGLITFMAHIGCFVPATRAKIGLLTKMYTRIHTIESVSTGMSTFATDLNQISLAVSGSNRNTLVLVDEFGKGTATIDGVSLLASCLMHWMEMNNDCPFVICSTHFHSLVKQNILPRTPLVRYNTLETLRDKESDDLVFLYQLTEGVASCSFAAYIALLAGVPKNIVVRGREVSSLVRENSAVRRYDSSSMKSFMTKCDAVVRKFLYLDLENVTEMNEFVRCTVRRGLDSCKDRENESGATCDLSRMTSVNSPSTTKRTRGSDGVRAAVVDDEGIEFLS